MYNANEKTTKLNFKSEDQIELHKFMFDRIKTISNSILFKQFLNSNIYLESNINIFQNTWLSVGKNFITHTHVLMY